MPLSRHRWIVRYEGDTVSLSEHTTLADARADARNWARQFGEPAILIHELDGESHVETVDPDLPAPMPADVEGSGPRAMNVTVIGTGNMARAVATRALAGGHHVTLIGTHLSKALDLADELTGQGPVRSSGEVDGDLVVLAVPFTQAPHAARQHSSELAGRVGSTSRTPSTSASWSRLTSRRSRRCRFLAEDGKACRRSIRARSPPRSRARQL